MKTYDLNSFFEIINYNFKKDASVISEICRYTKTRPKIKPPDSILSRGVEQTFLIKAVAEWSKAKSFFEIGTGRGTACYATALVPRIENILTLDILPFDFKRQTAIDYKPAHVSNEDIYNMIPFEQKQKIRFSLRKDVIPVGKKTPDENEYDLCFIDGDHTNSRVIFEDFVNCMRLMSDDGIIIWDDYGQPQYAVKKVVDKILEKDPSWHSVLIEQRGHLFGGDPEKKVGMVLMSKRELA